MPLSFKIYRIGLEYTGSGGGLVLTPNTAHVNVVAEDAFADIQRLYFTDSGDVGSVYSMEKTGTEAPVELFDEGSVEVRQLQIDRANGYIYYIRRAGSGTLCGVKRRLLRTGGSNVLLHNVVNAWGLEIDPANDRIWWSDGANNIGRITLAGGSPTNIYTGVSAPSNLVYDPVDDRLYAALQGSGRVTRGTPAGAGRVDYNSGSTTNFDWITHAESEGVIFAGGEQSGANGRVYKYNEAFTASDGSETDILGITTVSGAVWDETNGRLIYCDNRVFKSCLPDGTDVQTIRDCSAQFASPLYNLALG